MADRGLRLTSSTRVKFSGPHRSAMFKVLQPIGCKTFSILAKPRCPRRSAAGFKVRSGGFEHGAGGGGIFKTFTFHATIRALVAGKP